jgi:histidyl-tRNA synthetase
MATKVQTVKGTRDLLPPDTAVWAEAEAIARRVFALHGFQEIRTPIFEETDLFVRGVGESSDIVGKEMYSFEDKGGRHVTLRPENTAAVCRAYVQHGMQTWPQPVRLFYIGPQFRYERPQKGRYRQFHQIGAEYLGRRTPEADIEVLALLDLFFRELGFVERKVLVNTVGDKESREEFKRRLIAYLTPRAAELGEDSQRRLTTNPLRILDTKIPGERELLAGAPSLRECLSPASRDHFSRVLEGMASLDIRFEESAHLVRGLDYYTDTVFEIVSSDLGAQDALCGGGAYENLVEELGGPPTYGVGFAIGQDRLLDVLPDKLRQASQPKPPRALVLDLVVDAGAMPVQNDEARDRARRFAQELRRRGVPARFQAGRSAGAARKLAFQVGARFLVQVDSGRDAGVVTLHDVGMRTDEELPFDEALARIAEDRAT